MLINLKLLKFIIVITFFINPCVVFGNDIEKFANKLFNHYEYDDKINKYLKSFFSFGNSKSKTSLETKKIFTGHNTQNTKHIFLSAHGTHVKVCHKWEHVLRSPNTNQGLADIRGRADFHSDNF